MKGALAFGLASLLCFVAPPARGDDVAPGLESLDLRAHAEAALAGLRAPTGTYVAFDPDPTDVAAQVACDDDGDPVVVVSEAMLQLTAHVAQLAWAEPGAVARYAAYLARNQAPGRRVLPPPAGAFAKPGAVRAPTEVLVGALALILAREVARLRAGDLVCPHPTATRESGDGAWTAAEHAAAASTARSVYPANASVRDDAAFRSWIAAHGAHARLDLLAFFVAFEAEHRRIAARVVPTYLVTHPDSAAGHARAKELIAPREETP